MQQERKQQLVNLLTVLPLGLSYNGGFAQYTCALSVEAYAVNTSWSDDMSVSLHPLCLFYCRKHATSEQGLKAGERVLITGASGGVGSAAVQLAKRRGANVIAVAGSAKHEDIRALGADKLVARGADLVAAIGIDAIDLVVDLVAGPDFPQLLEVLRRGGRYATSGAIAGPMVELDIRTLYLKDRTLCGLHLSRAGGV